MDCCIPRCRRVLTLCLSLSALHLAACASQPAAPTAKAATTLAATPAEPVVERTAEEIASCNGLIKQRRVSVAQVRYLCGQPSFRDSWGDDAPLSSRDLAAVEEWYYNFGPNQPVQVLRFLKESLTVVSQDGPGFEPSSTAPACKLEDVGQGLSKYRLTLACGAPLLRQVYVVAPRYEAPSGNAADDALGKPAYREELAYRFSDGSIQAVTLENGRVLGVGEPPADGDG